MVCWSSITIGHHTRVLLPLAVLLGTLKPEHELQEAPTYITDTLPPSSLSGDEIQQLCLEIMVTQAQSSQNVTALLGLWVMPPLIHGLSVSSNKGCWATGGYSCCGGDQHSFGCEFSKSRVDTWALTRSEQLTVAGQETGKLWDLKLCHSHHHVCFRLFLLFMFITGKKENDDQRYSSSFLSGPHR